jgi:uncharacterized UBP type Zn finger protein
MLPWSLRQGSGCAHMEEATVETTDVYECPACVSAGDEWVHLRMCMVCGEVGCCDNSPNTHARKHFEATGHPVARTIEPGEGWIWCWPDKMTVGQVAAIERG